MKFSQIRDLNSEIVILIIVYNSYALRRCMHVHRVIARPKD